MRVRIPSLLIAFLLLVPSAGIGSSVEAADPAQEVTPTLFYFHGERRCSTCRSIEQAADTVVRGKFGHSLEKGALDWRVVNFERKEHRHYVEEIGLPGSSLVLARVSPDGGVRESRILHKVWTLSRDPVRMRQYIAAEIATYVGEAP